MSDDKNNLQSKNLYIMTIVTSFGPKIFYNKSLLKKWLKYFW